MAATKRAYKLQEFVAHSSNVNCLRIGRKTSRVVVTGGEDHKVNLWSIGKPNAILSLSGHTSAIESVCFDSSEVLVAAGAASGTIKLWDLEEAKIVRNLTGHRSNCISVDFHPFGEFFASGSLDTNLKIWDIRQKGCIQTYKGHTRGVNTIRFTPDGRLVISGGEDNAVKLWDLTAGKLVHDFKSHEGQIQCIDFHPHEFLLATGSADKTVKFWDLETFELIGSAGPETTGVRSITFNPDGRTLLCGLHESLKVFSWEPVRCHDTVDVGWSRLSDLNIHEGKLLGCSYNQSCVGVWVVDISQIQPYAVASVGRSNSRSDSKSFSASLRVQDDNNIITSTGRLSLSQNPESATTEAKTTASSRSAPSTPQRNGISTNPKVTSVNSTPSINTTVKRSSTKTRGATNPQKFSKSDEASVIVPRTSLRMEAISESKRVNDASFTTSDVVPVIVPRSSSRPELTSESQRKINFELKLTNFLKLSNAAYSDRSSKSMRSGYTGCKNNESDEDKPDAGSVIVPRTSSRVEAISASERDSGASSNKSDVVPVIVPRTSSRMELASESKRNIKFELKLTNFQKLSVASDLDRSSKSMHSGYTGSKNNESDEDEDMKFVSCADGFNGPASAGERVVDDFRCVRPIKIGDSRFMGPSTNYHDENYDIQVHKPRLACSVGAQKGGRTRSLAASWERDEQSPIFDNLQQQQEQPRQQLDRQQQHQRQQQSDATPTARMPYMMTETNQRARHSFAEVEAVSTSDEDTIADLMEQHKQFINSAQSRLTKLQVVHRLWKRKDMRGLISAMEKMSDHAVSADIISILIEKSDIVTLDTCTILLPLLTSLLGSNMDRHLGVSVEMLLKLVRIFGPVIHSSISAAPSVGVDLQAEQRLDRCNMCFIELEKVKHIIPHLTRRGGSIAKSTQELNLALQEVI